MRENPEISVIVPVYKAELYLSKCIDSILAQTFTNFELLLINDGSPDRSGDICEEYALQDKRIRIFHQKNAGVSVARNVGLVSMRGRYMAFVDPDDYIYPDYLKCLYDALRPEDGTGLIIQGLLCFDVDGNPLPDKRLPDRFYKEQDFGQAICECRLCEWGYSASKLYQTETIRKNNLWFDTRIRNLEDLYFMYQYLLNCDYLVLGSPQEYAYIRYINSISTTIHPFDAVYAGFQLYQSLLKQMMNRWRFPMENRDVIYRSMMLGFDWSLKTDYQSDRHVSRAERLLHLKCLIKNNYAVMCEHYYPVYKLDKIGKIFLRWGCFGLYDAYISMFIRFNIHSFLYAPVRNLK